MKRHLLAITLCLSASCQANCFKDAGKAFGIPPALLLSIAIKESHLNPSAVNSANRNHTEDVCMMQVNSTHFAHLASLGVSRTKLLSEPCTCVNTGHGCCMACSSSMGNPGTRWECITPGPRLHTSRSAIATPVMCAVFTSACCTASVRIPC
ncbi:invasion protein IagB [Ewingella americana]|uniref:Invasion protein IagB n=1 Tax=Ewingella americana TaxID=41202 RepID=A0A377NBT2_9GAMM|nr:invasion protein IagB [Ewingella americana]